MSERRLDLVYEKLADASTDVRNAIAGGYELVGNWSLSQILEHLNLTMQMTLDGPKFKANFLMRPIFRIILMPIVKKGKPVTLKANAPKSLAPASDLDEDRCVQQFYDLVAKLSDPSTEFQPFHPLLGNLNREQ